MQEILLKDTGEVRTTIAIILNHYFKINI